MKNTVKLAFAALVFTFAVVACQPKKTEEATAPAADSTVVETPVDSAATTPADSTATPADSTAHH